MVVYELLNTTVHDCLGPCFRCELESGDYYHVWRGGSLESAGLGPFDCCLDCARALGLVW